MLLIVKLVRVVLLLVLLLMKLTCDSGVSQAAALTTTAINQIAPSNCRGYNTVGSNTVEGGGGATATEAEAEAFTRGVFYNRVPKAASTSLKTLATMLAARNGFTHVSSRIYNDRGIWSGETQRENAIRIHRTMHHDFQKISPPLILQRNTSTTRPHAAVAAAETAAVAAVAAAETAATATLRLPFASNPHNNHNHDKYDNNDYIGRNKRRQHNEHHRTKNQQPQTQNKWPEPVLVPAAMGGTAAAALYDQHVRFLNFEQAANLRQPIMINMMREPVARAVSTYYFARTGTHSRRRQLRAILGSQADWSVDTCVRQRYKCRWLSGVFRHHSSTSDQLNSSSDEQDGSNNEEEGNRGKTSWEEIERQGRNYVSHYSHYEQNRQQKQHQKRDPFNLQTRFFCGHAPECAVMGPDALRRAKINLQRYYTLVGIAERFDESVALLEILIPAYFKGARQLLHGRGDGGGSSTSNDDAMLDPNISHNLTMSGTITLASQKNKFRARNVNKHAGPPPSPATIRVLQRLSRFDAALYRFAVRLFERRLRLCGLS